MITAEDIAAFDTPEAKEAFAAGEAFVRRKRKGIPEDRWTTSQSQHLVAACIELQWKIMNMQRRALEAMMNVETDKA